MMNGLNKEQAGRDAIKSHSTKCERVFSDVYRISPSKLSKKELEDLYFEMLDKNLELKKTVTSQQDNIKFLSTKVQRMTASQRNSLLKENKDCCAATKAVVQEQKASIADLRRANERMSERIRVLNMRLCTAKQFLKRSPSQVTSRCFKCLTTPPASMKHSSVSILHTRRSDGNPKAATASSQYLYKEVTTKDVETDTRELEKKSPSEVCDENKCRTLMEEFKQKIDNLQEELSHTHEEYTQRVTALERQVDHLQQQRGLQEEQSGSRVRELITRLREQEANYNDLSTQLSVEKSKVTELEMRLKVADASAQMAKKIDTHLASMNELRRASSKVDSQFVTSTPREPPHWEVSSLRLEVPQSQLVANQISPGTTVDRDETKLSKHSDDSGYTDVNRSHECDDDNKALFKLNKQLLERISDLQQQLDTLKMDAINEAKNTQLVQNKGLESEDIGTRLIENVELNNVTDNTQQDVVRKVTIESNKKSSTEHSPDRDDKSEGKLRSKEQSVSVCKVNELWNSYDEPATTNETIEGSICRPIKSEQVDQCLENTRKYLKEPVPAPRQKPIKIASNVKSDSHNGLQIPGPLPVDGEANISVSKEKPWSRAKRRLIGVKTAKDSNHSSDSSNRNNGVIHHGFTIQNSGELVKTTQYYPNSKNETLKLAVNGSKGNFKVGEKEIESLDEVKTSDVKRNGAVVNASNETHANHAGVQAGLLDTHRLGKQMDNKQQGNQQSTQQPRPHSSPQRQGRRWPSRDRTYSVAGDNTDYEISSLTDLPDEGDDAVASYSEPLSPGEHKATSTDRTDGSTDHSDHSDHTAATTDCGSLSEGELPAHTAVRKRSSVSKGIPETKPVQPVPVTQKVEEALQAISEELARCRELMHTQNTLGVNIWSSF